MKAYGFTRYGKADVQQMLDLPSPSPMGHELLVQVRAAGVNPVDVAIRSGAMKDQTTLEPPVAFGSEVSGVVLEVGADVDGFVVGDEVFGASAPGGGGLSEQAVLTASETAKKPGGLSWAHAAVLPVAAATAYDALEQLALRSGQTLLVVGAGGGVGLVVLQLARDRGITAIGVASEGKRAVIEAFGAMFVPKGDGVVDTVRTSLPDGVHAVLDLVGGTALEGAAQLASPGSVVSTIDVDTVERLGGSYVRRSRSAAVLSTLADLVINGSLDPHVVETVALTDAQQAVSAVEQGSPPGKVVVLP